ncbi:MAG: hypothetical protein L6R41_000067 [Letrouitia leprolyta]|nr:MAG: hypothetical protein L6R41_000067 [Letrouitia leprolyta]
MAGYESNPMAGNAACSYGGVVYPDSGSPFPIPPLGPQFIHNTTNGSATTSTMTMSMILSAPVKVTTLLTMPGLSLPTGIATLYPNIGGYGNSSITGTGTPAPTQPSLPPNPSATFIGGTARLTVNLGLLTGLLMVFGLILFA